MILETSVERARWCVWAGVWHEVTTRQANACKEERQSQALAQACQRARSALTHPVIAIEGAEDCFHAGLQRMRSGQLRFQG